MARKTNKTSHVLNLITGGNTVSGETEASRSAKGPPGFTGAVICCDRAESSGGGFQRG